MDNDWKHAFPWLNRKAKILDGNIEKHNIEKNDYFLGFYRTFFGSNDVL